MRRHSFLSLALTEHRRQLGAKKIWLSASCALLKATGYNFRSLQHITPFLEPTTSGITSLWARTTALKYNCVVTVGYPEKVDITPKWPASPEYYNSAVIVNSEGQTIANYRKSFLYYTDETWALEGPDGFYDGYIEGLGNTAMGICKWPTTSFEREYMYSTLKLSRLC
jgi:protein N-terminal amidase